MTFAFVDVVQSTRNFTEYGDGYVVALAEVHARIARHTVAHQGVVVETEGDGAFLAFPDARSAVTALCALQDDLDTDPTEPVPLRLRAGAHTGQADPVGAGYVALPAHLAARVTAAASAGQVLVSDTTMADLAAAEADDLGTFALKDVSEPVRLWRMHGDATPPRASPARRTNVEEPHTTFVGRNSELEDLTRTIAEHRLVTIVGAGGSGKTRLLSQWALDTTEDEGSFVWFAELATASTPDQVVPIVASACGVVAKDINELAEALAAREPSVIVLDNCEHVIDVVAPLVEALLDRCPEARLLCTSREPLAVSGEVVRRLGPVTAAEASTLFRRRASSAGCDLSTLTDAVVDGVCDALDRLPLALELAALHARTVPADALLRVVREEVATLDRRGGEERQRSVDAMLAWSLRDLTAAELDGLLALSLWPGRFDQGMSDALLERVSSTSPGVVRALVRKNLVDLDGADFRLLFPIREAARGRLVQRPDLEAQSRAGLVGWAVQHARRTYGGDGNYDDEPIDRLLALEQGLVYEPELGIAEIAWVWELLRVNAHHSDTSPTLRAEAVRALDHGRPVDLRDALVHAAALRVMTFYGEPYPLPEAHLDAILQLVRDGPCPPVLSMSAISAVAWELDLDGRSEDALALWLEATALVADDPHVVWARPGLIGAVATSHMVAGDLETAIELGYESVASGQQQGVVRDMNILHGNLAEMLLAAERPGEAVPQALEAVKLTPIDGSTRAFFLRSLATAYWRTGDTESAMSIGRPLVRQLRERASDSAFYRDQFETLRRDVPALAERESN